MKLLIEIDETDYTFIKNECIVPIKIDTHIYEAIRNGKKLPDYITLPDGAVYSPDLYYGCNACASRNSCPDAFHSNAVHCGAYGEER